MTSRTHEIAKIEGKTFTGYLSLPPSGKGPGLLLLQEIYGLVDDIKGLADLFAKAGYVVLAPDVFFWRKQSDLTFAYSDREGARAALIEIGGDGQVAKDIPLAFDSLRNDVPEVEGKVGLLGFGFGAILGYRDVVNGELNPDFAVAYFPARLALEKADAISQPWLFHFPENDAVAEADLYARTRDAYAHDPKVKVLFYPQLGHGFAIPGRPEFDKEQAKAAHEKSYAFLKSVTARETASV